MNHPDYIPPFYMPSTSTMGFTQSNYVPREVLEIISKDVQNPLNEEQEIKQESSTDSSKE